MATDLPDTPESREESYLADIAGQDVELPEKPLSRKEQYLAYIAENGGGGGGGTSNFNQLSNRPKYNGATMTGDTSIPEVKTYSAGSNVSISSGNVISATDTTYSNFTGTDGTAAGAAGLVPAPATTDAGKFLKADGTWDTAGGGGGGDTVYSTKTTSNSAQGGAVYIGNLDSDQNEQPDPTTTDDHYKYFWALPAINSYIPDSRSINIMGSYSKYNSVVIGCDANNPIGADCVAIGGDATARAQGSVAIGQATYIDNNLTNSVALGKRAVPTRSGEVNIGNNIGGGYNSTNYRVLGGVHDGQLAQDAVTVAQVNATIDAINTALSTNIPHIGAAS